MIFAFAGPCLGCPEGRMSSGRCACSAASGLGGIRGLPPNLSRSLLSRWYTPGCPPNFVAGGSGCVQRMLDVSLAGLADTPVVSRDDAAVHVGVGVAIGVLLGFVLGKSIGR